MTGDSTYKASPYSTVRRVQLHKPSMDNNSVIRAHQQRHQTQFSIVSVCNNNNNSTRSILAISRRMFLISEEEEGERGREITHTCCTFVERDSRAMISDAHTRKAMSKRTLYNTENRNFSLLWQNPSVQFLLSRLSPSQYFPPLSGVGWLQVLLL